MKRPEF